MAGVTTTPRKWANGSGKLNNEQITTRGKSKHSTKWRLLFGSRWPPHTRLTPKGKYIIHLTSPCTLFTLSSYSSPIIAAHHPAVSCGSTGTNGNFQVTNSTVQRLESRWFSHHGFIWEGRLSRSLTDNNAAINCMDVHCTHVWWKCQAWIGVKRLNINATTKQSAQRLAQWMSMSWRLSLMLLWNWKQRQKAHKDLFETNKFPLCKDTDSKGNAVEQNGTDDNYSTSQTMIVHHEENRKRMEATIRKAATARKNNKCKKAKNYQGYFTQNVACEEIICL